MPDTPKSSSTSFRLSCDWNAQSASMCRTEAGSRKDCLIIFERVGDLSSASGDTISCNATKRRNLPEIFACSFWLHMPFF